jgi:hypothetical protein
MCGPCNTCSVKWVNRMECLFRKSPKSANKSTLGGRKCGAEIGVGVGDEDLFTMFIVADASSAGNSPETAANVWRTMTLKVSLFFFCKSSVASMGSEPDGDAIAVRAGSWGIGMGTSLAPETVTGVGNAGLISWADARLWREMGQAQLSSDFSSGFCCLLWIASACQTWD